MDATAQNNDHVNLRKTAANLRTIQSGLVLVIMLKIRDEELSFTSKRLTGVRHSDIELIIYVSESETDLF